MKQKNQPHDRFFKAMFEHIEFAGNFFKTKYFNQQVGQEMDWETLELWDTAMVGENNKQIIADVVYRVLTKESQEAFIIINHERKHDRTLPIRRMEYKLGALRKAIKQNKEPALIYFVTFYNGPGHYASEKGILDFFSKQDIAEEIFLKDEVVAAKQLPDEEILESGETSIFLIFLKYADDPRFLEWLLAHPAWARQLENNKYLKRPLEYLLEVGVHQEEDLLAAFEKASPKLKDTMLTTQKRIEKRGMQLGIRKNKEEMAKLMLKEGEPQEKVIRFTGLPAKEILKLKENLALSN